MIHFAYDFPQYEGFFFFFLANCLLNKLISSKNRLLNQQKTGDSFELSVFLFLSRRKKIIRVACFFLLDVLLTNFIQNETNPKWLSAYHHR